MQPLLAFGSAFLEDDAASVVVYKLLGSGASENSYELILEANSGLESYMTKFTLQDVIDAVENEAGVGVPGDMLVAGLKERFDGPGFPDASVDEGGLQLAAAHSFSGFDITLRLPPAGARAPRLADPRRAAWVAQDLLCTQSDRLRMAQHPAAEERCPLEQQWDDAAAFLATVGADGAGSPSPPRAAQHKRKRREEAVPPATGSAVKAARPSGTAAAAGAGPAAATRPAAAAAQPASTQQTGAGSRQTQGSKQTVHISQNIVSGRGRGRAGMVKPRRPGKK